MGGKEEHNFFLFVVGSSPAEAASFFWKKIAIFRHACFALPYIILMNCIKVNVISTNKKKLCSYVMTL